MLCDLVSLCFELEHVAISIPEVFMAWHHPSIISHSLTQLHRYVSEVLCMILYDRGVLEPRRVSLDTELATSSRAVAEAVPWLEAVGSAASCFNVDSHRPAKPTKQSGFTYVAFPALLGSSLRVLVSLCLLS